MALPTLSVSRAFREQALATYPGLASDPAFRGLFATLIAPGHRDEETDAPVLSAQLLASLEGKTPQFQARNYCGDDFIERYREQTGHHIELTAADFRQGRARTLAKLNLEPALQQAWEQELTTVTDKRVAFVSGRRLTRQGQADQRRANREEAATRTSGYAETQAALDYLNQVPVQVASRAVTAHLDEAVAIAGAATNVNRRQQDLLTLRYMQDQPKQHFGASSRGRSRRCFPVHPGYGTLSKEVAAVIGQDWFEFDLRNAQLAIAARLWDVSEVDELLQSARSVWDVLLPELAVGRNAKAALKDGLYALQYGAGDTRVEQAICDRLAQDGLAEIDATDLARRLLAFEPLKALQQARDRELRRILKDEGGRDRYGAWIPMPKDQDLWLGGNLEDNPRSVLAAQAQAVEFWLLEPVFELARGTADFRIAHFAHDGFSITISDRRRVAGWLWRIAEAVNRRAAEAGIQTALELTHDPREHRCCGSERRSTLVL
jgi:hypothetical protein